MAPAVKASRRSSGGGSTDEHPLSFARLHERGATLGRWLDAGGRVDRLVALEANVRQGRVTDWPGRPPGPEPRTAPPGGGLPAWRERGY